MQGQIVEIATKVVGFAMPDDNDTDPDGNSVDREAVERLRRAVEHAGGRVAAARKAGVPLGSLNNWLKGRDPKRAALVALADGCQVSLEWLASGRGSMVPGEEGVPTALVVQSPGEAPPGYVVVPRFNVQASAGGGSLVAHEQVVDYFAFSEHFMRHVLGYPTDDVTVIEVRGDSMQPTLYHGDAVLVLTREDQALENGQLYVMELGGSLIVKRVQLSATGGVTLLSDNSRYAPERVTRDELLALRIIGRVLWRGGPPRS